MRGPKIEKITRARNLRREQTPAESKLWAILRNRQLDGIKFTRQEPIGNYIADFACRSSKLIIEIDGPSHDDTVVYDQRRTEFLQSVGYRVIRFRNEDMFGDLGPVMDQIRKHL